MRKLITLICIVTLFVTGCMHYDIESVVRESGEFEIQVEIEMEDTVDAQARGIALQITLMNYESGVIGFDEIDESYEEEYQEAREQLMDDADADTWQEVEDAYEQGELEGEKEPFLTTEDMARDLREEGYDVAEYENRVVATKKWSDFRDVTYTSEDNGNIPVFDSTSSSYVYQGGFFLDGIDDDLLGTYHMADKDILNYKETIAIEGNILEHNGVEVPSKNMSRDVSGDTKAIKYELLDNIWLEGEEVIYEEFKVEFTLDKEPIEFMYKRIAGANRYETAVQISQNIDSPEAVVLARGDDFPDALAGTPLAYNLNAPLLLTRSDLIPGIVMDEIDRINPESVYVLGGEAAISDNVVEQLSDYSVNRVSGQNRFETAIEVAKMYDENPEKVYMVTGEEFADAVSIASIAAIEQAPIVLTHSDRLPDETRAYIEDAEVTIVGGSNAVCETVYDEDSRIYGANRSQTSLEVVNEKFEEPEQAMIATGRTFPDSLTGGVWAANMDIPVVLTNDRYITQEISGMFDKQIILGGSQAIEVKDK